MSYKKLSTNQTEKLVEILGGMSVVESLLSGDMEIKVINHIIDCDSDPRIPYDLWKVESHIKGGQLKWNKDKVKLHLSVDQLEGKSIIGYRIRNELKNFSVMNANVLDYLLDYPQFIPKEWKESRVFFFGTIYRHPQGALCVRCLLWFGGNWREDHNWLKFAWQGRNPALVSAT